MTRDNRSSSSATERSGGQVNSFGMTDHSFASTTGTRISPSETWRPSVTWKSHAGRVGQLKNGRCRKPTLPGIDWCSRGP